MNKRAKIIALPVFAIIVCSMLIHLLKTMKIGIFAMIGDWSLYFMIIACVFGMIVFITIACYYILRSNKK